MEQSNAPSPAIIFDTLLAYQRTAALRAAVQLDLFNAVGEGPAGAASLARKCSASERGTRILCDYLVIMEPGETSAHTEARWRTTSPAPGSYIMIPRKTAT